MVNKTLRDFQGNAGTKKPHPPAADEATLINSLDTSFQRNQQTYIALLHPGELVLGEPSYGDVPFLVTEARLVF